MQGRGEAAAADVFAAPSGNRPLRIVFVIFVSFVVACEFRTVGYAGIRGVACRLVFAGDNPRKSRQARLTDGAAL